MKLEKNEVLRYLGYGGQTLSPQLNTMIDQAMAECVQVAKPLYTYGTFSVRPEQDEIAVEGTTLRLEGSSILGHLRHAKKIAVLAATLGPAIETRIRLYERSDLTRSLILDAAATQMIEQVCDGAEAEIQRLAAEEGFVTNFRFSPGYGDLTLDIQPLILQVVNAGRKIGLTCTENNILLPRKSVTAIIGFLGEPDGTVPKRSCEICQFRDTCAFRERGMTCGSTKTDRE